MWTRVCKKMFKNIHGFNLHYLFSLYDRTLRDINILCEYFLQRNILTELIFLLTQKKRVKIETFFINFPLKSTFFEKPNLFF